MSSKTEKTTEEKIAGIFNFTKEQIKSIERIPPFEYDGIIWPTFPPFRMKGIEKGVKDIMDIQSRDTDIMICTHAKSGTHWIYEITKMLLANTNKLDKESKANAMLEMLPNFDILEQCLHQVQYGSWYEYELGMEQAEKDYPGMIYTCYYEDMKKHPEREMKKLAEFLGVKRSDETIKSIVNETSFDNMQKNKFDVTSILDGKGFIYRKGEIGDWKNHFTVAQNDKFDAQYQERMKDSNYKFTFE